MGAAASVWRFLAGPRLLVRKSSKEQITPVKGLPALPMPGRPRYEFRTKHLDSPWIRWPRVRAAPHPLAH